VPDVAGAAGVEDSNLATQTQLEADGGYNVYTPVDDPVVAEAGAEAPRPAKRYKGHNAKGVSSPESSSAALEQHVVQCA
jgi:hypothetical protein